MMHRTTSPAHHVRWFLLNRFEYSYYFRPDADKDMIVFCKILE